MKHIVSSYASEKGLDWQPGKNLEYLSYYNGTTRATLDGEFTANQLEAIAMYMRLNGKK